MIEGQIIIDSDHPLWDHEYYRSYSTSNKPFDLYGNFLTYPLEKNQEFCLLPMDDDWWNRFPVLIDQNLNVYYQDQKIINLRQLAQYYFPWKISCDNCKCDGFEHDENCRCPCVENDPDEQAQDQFYFYVTNGLYFADSCDYELFKSRYYDQISIYPGEFKIGDATIVNASVHITAPYGSLNLPFISNKEPITKNIDYLMKGVYNRQIYATILCFKPYGDLPLLFLEKLRELLRY